MPWTITWTLQRRIGDERHAGLWRAGVRGRGLEKLRHLRAAAGSRLLLSVDGGVNLDTVGSCAAAGADLFVTGSALFSQPHYGRFIDEMTGIARSVKEVRV